MSVCDGSVSQGPRTPVGQVSVSRAEEWVTTLWDWLGGLEWNDIESVRVSCVCGCSGDDIESVSCDCGELGVRGIESVAELI